jgi:hypothetical protein
LFLEDESGRIKIKGMEEQVNCLVTGVVVAVKGIVDESGKFQVFRFTFIPKNCLELDFFRCMIGSLVLKII